MDKWSELEAAAKAATPGPWWFIESDGEISCESRRFLSAIATIELGFDAPFENEQLANAAFIAAANPQAIQQLIAENRALVALVRDAYEEGNADGSGRATLNWRDSCVKSDMEKITGEES